MHFGTYGLPENCVELIHRKFGELQRKRYKPTAYVRSFSPPATSRIPPSPKVSPVCDESEIFILPGGAGVHDLPSWDPDLRYLLSGVFVDPF